MRTAYYQYDASGQRVRKTLTDSNDGRVEERKYVGGLWEVYSRWQEGAPAELTLRRETLHLMDDQDRVALRERRTQGWGEEPELVWRYQLADHLGSAGIEVDEYGSVISYEEYYPYGTTSFQSGRSSAEVSLKRYRYTGKERDEETGLNYHGARYYAPWLARWCAIDPMQGERSWLSPYNYCQNDPINRTDPTGAIDRRERSQSPSAAAGVGAAAAATLPVSPAPSGPIPGIPTTLGPGGGRPRVEGDETRHVRRPNDTSTSKPSLFRPSGAPGMPRQERDNPLRGEQPVTIIASEPAPYDGPVMSATPYRSAGEAARIEAFTVEKLKEAGYNADRTPGLLVRLEHNKTFGAFTDNIAVPMANIAGGLEVKAGLMAVGRGLAKAESSALLQGFASAPTGKYYSVAYEMKLPSNLHPGKGYYSHFKSANESLNAAMASDATFASAMSELGITVPKSSTGSIIGKSPTNWVWHHNAEPGIMQLVPKAQHTTGSPFWNTMHPNGVGGMSLWGK